MKTFKWTEKQKKALRGSIIKWKKIANGTGVDDGTRNCPCCKLWRNHKCVGCPIKEFTDVSRCDQTPYDVWYREGLYDTREYNDYAKSLAISFANFIRAVYLAGGGK